MRTSALRTTSAVVLLAFSASCASSPASIHYAERTPSSAQSVVIQEALQTNKVAGAGKFMNGLLRLNAPHEMGLIGKVKNIPVEMLRFYTAVGIMESFRCFVHRDPTFCTSYGDSLWGDQAVPGHLGFAAFMVVADGVNSRLSRVLSRKLRPETFQSQMVQLPLGQIGMMAGMTFQTLGQQLAMHPKTEEYFKMDKSKLSREELNKKRNEWLAALFKDTVGSSDWNYDLFIDGVNLFLAVAAATVTSPLISKGFKTIGGEGMVEKFLSHDKVKFNGNMKAAGFLTTQLIHALAGTILFLTYADISPFPDWAHTRRAKGKLVKAQEAFEEALKKEPGGEAVVSSLHAARNIAEDKAPEIEAPADAEVGPSAKGDDKPSSADIDELKKLLSQLKDNPAKPKLKGTAVEKAGMALAAAWDEYRNTLLQATRMIQYRHAEYLGKFDEKMAQIYYSYQWLAEGANKESKTFKENPVNWQTAMPDPAERIHAFFCGGDVEKSVISSMDIFGFPVPGRGSPDFVAPRVAKDHPEFCDGSLKATGTPEQVQEERNTACKADPRLCTSTEAWNHTFRKGHWAEKTYLELMERKALIAKSYAKETDELFTAALKVAEPERAKIISRYDGQIQQSLVETLTGLPIAIKEGRAVEKKSGNPADSVQPDAKNGILAAYATEKNYWSELSKMYPKNEALFSRLSAQLEAKETAAKDLLKHSVQSLQERSLAAAKLLEDNAKAAPQDGAALAGDSSAMGALADETQAPGPSSAEPGAPSQASADPAAPGNPQDLLSALMGGGGQQQEDPDEAAAKAVVQSWKDYILQ